MRENAAIVFDGDPYVTNVSERAWMSPPPAIVLTRRGS